MGVFETLPYTNFQNTNLDFILKKLGELEADVAEVVELSKTWRAQVETLNARMLAIEEENQAIRALYDTFVEEINTRFEDLNTEFINNFETLRQSIDQRFNALELEVNNNLANFNIRLKYLNNKLDDTLANLPDYIIMTDPFTGQPNNITNIIAELASGQKVDSITASEYDALELTAQAYDNYEITAYDYDWNGKNILSA